MVGLLDGLPQPKIDWRTGTVLDPTLPYTSIGMINDNEPKWSSSQMVNDLNIHNAANNIPLQYKMGRLDQLPQQNTNAANEAIGEAAAKQSNSPPNTGQAVEKLFGDVGTNEEPFTPKTSVNDTSQSQNVYWLFPTRGLNKTAFSPMPRNDNNEGVLNESSAQGDIPRAITNRDDIFSFSDSLMESWAKYLGVDSKNVPGIIEAIIKSGKKPSWLDIGAAFTGPQEDSNEYLKPIWLNSGKPEKIGNSTIIRGSSWNFNDSTDLTKEDIELLREIQNATTNYMSEMANQTETAQLTQNTNETIPETDVVPQTNPGIPVNPLGQSIPAKTYSQWATSPVWNGKQAQAAGTILGLKSTWDEANTMAALYDKKLGELNAQIRNIQPLKDETTEQRAERIRRMEAQAQEIADARDYYVGIRDGAAHQAEEYRKATAAMGINLDGFGNGNTLQEAEMAYAMQTSRAVDRLLNSKSTKQWTSEVEHDLIAHGVSPDRASRVAKMRQQDRRNELLRGLNEGLSLYGTNPNGSLNEIGLQILGRMSEEDPQLVSLYTGQMPSMKDEYTRRNVLDMAELQNAMQSGLVDQRAYWNLRAMGLQHEQAMQKLGVTQNYDWKKFLTGEEGKNNRLIYQTEAENKRTEYKETQQTNREMLRQEEENKRTMAKIQADAALKQITLQSNSTAYKMIEDYNAFVNVLGWSESQALEALRAKYTPNNENKDTMQVYNPIKNTINEIEDLLSEGTEKSRKAAELKMNTLNDYINTQQMENGGLRIDNRHWGEINTRITNIKNLFDGKIKPSVFESNLRTFRGTAGYAAAESQANLNAEYDRLHRRVNKNT